MPPSPGLRDDASLSVAAARPHAAVGGRQPRGRMPGSRWRSRVLAAHPRGRVGRVGPALLAGLLLAALVAPSQPGLAGPAGSEAPHSLSGSGDSVVGAWTWETLPGQAAPPPLRAGEQVLTYTFRLADPALPEERDFNLALDLGAGWRLDCDRSGDRGTRLADGLGAGVVRVHGVPFSRGTCSLDHPWDQQAWPRAVMVAYEGILAEDSCEPATLPSALPYLGGFRVPPATCQAPFLGNLQAWAGAGLFFAEHRVDGAPEPDPDAMTRSAAPWEGDWRWTRAGVEAQLPLVQDDADLAFAHASAPGDAGLAYHASATLATLPLTVDCLRDPTTSPASAPAPTVAPAPGAGVGFLRAPETGAVLSVGSCVFEPGIAVAQLRGTFPLPTGACGLPTMATTCSLAGVREDLAGQGVFFR